MPDIITWIDPNGTELVLTGQTTREVERGRAGLDMPPIRFIEDLVPYQAGARLRRTNVGVREVDIPLVVWAASSSALRTAVRSLLQLLDPVRGTGKLRVSSEDGTERELYCRYAGGLEGLGSGSAGGPAWRRLVLVFRAVDPYWYGRQAIITTFGNGTPLATFFPFFPLRLVSSPVLGDLGATISNAGEVETWPVWELTGPGTDFTLLNLTTGDELKLETTLNSGQVVTIDTRPGAKTVELADGTSLFGYLSTDSVMWSIPLGTSAVQFEASGASATTSVKLTYQSRFLGC